MLSRISQSPLGAVPTDLIDFFTLVTAQQGIAQITGLKLVHISGKLSCVPQNAPAAGTRGGLALWLIKADAAVPANNRDPAAAGAAAAFNPLWFSGVAAPLTALPVSTLHVVQSDVRIGTRVKPVMRDASDRIFLTASEANAALNWHVDGWVKHVWRMP